MGRGCLQSLRPILSLQKSQAVLLLLFGSSDQEKHRAARFVLPFGILIQRFWRWLRFAKLLQGETSVNERIDVGGNGTMIFDNIVTQKSCLTQTFLLVMVNRPV